LLSERAGRSLLEADIACRRREQVAKSLRQ